MIFVEFFHPITKTKVKFEVNDYEKLKKEFAVLREKAVEMIGACEAEVLCLAVFKDQNSAAES